MCFFLQRYFYIGENKAFIMKRTSALIAASLSLIAAEYPGFSSFNPSSSASEPSISSSLSHDSLWISLDCSLTNKAALVFARDTLGFLQRSTLEILERKYQRNSHSSLSHYFHLFDSFSYEGKDLDPRNSLDRMFALSYSLYEGAHTSVFYEPRYRTQICEGLHLLKEVAAWGESLVQRKNASGTLARHMLRKKGVLHPEYLMKDAGLIEKAVLEWYDLQIHTVKNSGLKP